MGWRQRLHQGNTFQVPESWFVFFLVLNCSLTSANISHSFNTLVVAYEKSLCSMIYTSVILLSKGVHIKNAYICMNLNLFAYFNLILLLIYWLWASQFSRFAILSGFFTFLCILCISLMPWPFSLTFIYSESRRKKNALSKEELIWGKQWLSRCEKKQRISYALEIFLSLFKSILHKTDWPLLYFVSNVPLKHVESDSNPPIIILDFAVPLCWCSTQTSSHSKTFPSF